MSGDRRWTPEEGARVAAGSEADAGSRAESRGEHGEEDAMNKPQPDATQSVRTIDAQLLLGERGLLHIEHQGERYTLRLTRNNRLILTK